MQSERIRPQVVRFNKLILIFGAVQKPHFAVEVMSLSCAVLDLRGDANKRNFVYFRPPVSDVNGTAFELPWLVFFPGDISNFLSSQESPFPLDWGLETMMWVLMARFPKNPIVLIRANRIDDDYACYENFLLVDAHGQPRGASLPEHMIRGSAVDYSYRLTSQTQTTQMSSDVADHAQRETNVSLLSMPSARTTTETEDPDHASDDSSPAPNAAKHLVKLLLRLVDNVAEGAPSASAIDPAISPMAPDEDPRGDSPANLSESDEEWGRYSLTRLAKLPQLVLAGFSKGHVVLNALLSPPAEEPAGLRLAEDEPSDARFYTALWSRVRALHYLDPGLDLPDLGTSQLLLLYPLLILPPPHLLHARGYNLCVGCENLPSVWDNISSVESYVASGGWVVQLIGMGVKYLS